MHNDKILTGIVILSFAVLLLILILKRLKQPYFVAYILAGVLLGPDVLGIFNKEDFIFQFGELGLILLMFFIGAEIKLPDLSGFLPSKVFYIKQSDRYTVNFTAK